MKCKTIHKDLIFFLEGDLPEKKMNKIKTHLSGCKDCVMFAEDIKKTLGTIEIEKSTEIYPFFYTRLKANLESQIEPEKVPFWNLVFVRAIQPAFFSLLLIAGIYAGFKIGTPVDTNLTSAEFTNEEIIPYLNEMQSESIENFLME